MRCVQVGNAEPDAGLPTDQGCKLGRLRIYARDAETNALGYERRVAELLLLELQWQTQRVSIELDGSCEVADEDIDVPESGGEHGYLLVRR